MTSYTAFAREPSRTRGVKIAEGTADDVAVAALAFEGFVGSTIRVVLTGEDAPWAEIDSRVVTAGRWSRRTPYGHDLHVSPTEEREAWDAAIQRAKRALRTAAPTAVEVEVAAEVDDVRIAVAVRAQVTVSVRGATPRSICPCGLNRAG